MRPATRETVLRLWLAVEAEQLPLMESAATLTAAKVDLLPHQIVLTYRIANASPRRVEIRGEKGQIQQRVAVIALNAQGERCRRLEQLNDALLRLEPNDDPFLDPSHRVELVRNILPEMIRRDLGHAGILADGASFAARLLAWAEVS